MANAIGGRQALETPIRVQKPDFDGKSIYRAKTGFCTKVLMEFEMVLYYTGIMSQGNSSGKRKALNSVSSAT